MALPVDEEATMIEDIIAPGKYDRSFARDSSSDRGISKSSSSHRATIIQPNRPSLGYVQQQNIYCATS